MVWLVIVLGTLHLVPVSDTDLSRVEVHALAPLQLLHLLVVIHDFSHQPHTHRYIKSMQVLGSHGLLLPGARPGVWAALVTSPVTCP